MHDLTEIEALLILPAVVDNEASQDEKEAFFAFIAENGIVRNQYNDALFMKRLLSEKLVKKTVPPHLKKTIFETLKKLEIHEEQHSTQVIRMDQPITDRNFRLTAKNKSSTLLLRYLSAAAVLLILTLVTIQILNRIPLATNSSTQILENVSLEHFILNEDKRIEPQSSFTTTSEAEQFLADHHQLTITVPHIEGAEIAGIGISAFTDDFYTPLLEYYQRDINETIYLFAFDMDKVSASKSMTRNIRAAEVCTETEDFYVTEIDNYHVVSWLWENTWYTAVSNHNGYDLAALVEPLNYSN